MLALESRRATEIAALITTFGGDPRVAPSLREVPLERNSEALDFAAAPMLDEFDIVVFLTGVGATGLDDRGGSARAPARCSRRRWRAPRCGPRPEADGRAPGTRGSGLGDRAGAKYLRN